jgi:hypothetical protein
MKHHTICLIVCTLALTACEDPIDPTKSTYTTDQCLRSELFAKCMAAIPAGPISPKYNDWDEVVGECGSAAFYQAQRQRRFVKPECAL